MKTAPNPDDQIFWQDRIGADETLLWYARASHSLGPITRILTLLMFGYGAYLSYQAIFIYSSADQFCDTFKQSKCSIFFYFAWPILIFSFVLCAIAALAPLTFRKGWLIRRYAITNRMAYGSLVGIRNAERSAPLLGQPPVRMMDSMLKISNNLAFSGLTASEFEGAIAAASEAQRGAL